MSTNFNPVDFSWLKNFDIVPAESVEPSINNYDALLIITTESDFNPTSPHLKVLDEYFDALNQYREIDEDFESNICFTLLDGKKGPCNKIIHSPVGHLNEDYDDVRRFSEAAHKALKRALKIRVKKFLILLPNKEIKTLEPEYAHFHLVALLGAMAACYVPLEIRELGKMKTLSQKFDVSDFRGVFDSKMLTIARAIEAGRTVCRDIGGSDPERMAPPRVASYVQQLFDNTCIKVNINENEEFLEYQYPLLTAVNRAARGIERHNARVIFLTYEPKGPYEKTIVLVGKGVTFDTGGATVKTNGAMNEMHRDKCGAAAVTGFFQVLAMLQPKGIKVLGVLSVVRNSIGSDCLVPDEIITSRSGKRVRIQNTDQEGRLAMADVLCHMKEKVVNEKDPHLFTIATLTSHAALTVGPGYSIIMDNGPARKANVGLSLQKAGHLMGDMFEVSTIRREDYEFHDGPSVYEDLLQGPIVASRFIDRGHQKPAAFLIRVSGLDEHGIGSEKPLKYSHIDICGSSGPFPGVPSGVPIPALVKHFILPLVDV